jgi:hypothetical protein
MGAVIHQLRRVTRSLVRAPAFSGTVVVTLGLGIGLSTAVSTVTVLPVERSHPE